MPLNVVINDRHSDVAIWWLLTFRDYNQNIELRAVSNNEPVISRGETYEPFPFDVVLPADEGDRIKSMQLVVPNVARDLMELVRRYSSELRPLVTMEMVLSDNPDQVEMKVDFLSIDSASYDPLTVRFNLSSSGVFVRKTSLATYNSAEFPGIFHGIR